VVNAQTPLLQFPIPGEAVTAVTFSPEGHYLAAAGSDGAVRVWDRDGVPFHENPLRGPEGLGALAFSPDESRLAGVNREHVQVWDVSSGQDVLFLRGAGPRRSDNGFNPRVVWSHDGKRLAASNWDRTVSVWDAADFRSPEGKATLVAQAGTRAFLWHLARAETYSRPETASAAAFHRERLLALTPLTREEREQRGDFGARSGRWDRAMADYTVLCEGDLPEAPWTCAAYGSLLLNAGDVVAYQKLRGRVLSRWADSRDAPHLRAVVHLCGRMPMSVEESAELLRLARRFHELMPGDAEASACLGLAFYRAGEVEQAKQSLLRAVKERPEGDGEAVAWVVLSLVYLRQGLPEEAGPWLKRVDAWLAERSKQSPPATSLAPIGCDWNAMLEVRRLRNEADMLRLKPIP
jgi:tetratricopeptide (TPR) repeat protein